VPLARGASLWRNPLIQWLIVHVLPGSRNCRLAAPAEPGETGLHLVADIATIYSWL
jgi:hypothetical protein